jgi:glycosyltransferase involved in cell wall biosynthesis
MNKFSKRAGEVIAVVIPSYRVEEKILSVLSSIPSYVDYIIVVDDASPDKTCDIVQNISDPRIHLLHHEKNKGVGGAMLTGYSYALFLGADIIAKVDGDGQMDLKYLEYLLDPIQRGRADYTKGNRFLHARELKKMPKIRKVGNYGLTFFAKIASGYWNIFDPTNGYTAISAEKLLSINPYRISTNYFFEISMLCELHYLDAVVEDIPIPAIYDDEISSLLISRDLLIFSKNLLKRTFYRLFYQYFFFDFSATSFYIISGLVFGIFGVIWGILKWVESSQMHIPATTGTVLIAVLPILIAFQFLMQAIALDISNVPTSVRNITKFYFCSDYWKKFLYPETKKEMNQ